MGTNRYQMNEYDKDGNCLKITLITPDYSTPDWIQNAFDKLPVTENGYKVTLTKHMDRKYIVLEIRYI